jgi:ABC-type transporter Mla maintaining outer membrane lipid asymmetry ATPase subunit MlaF
MPNILDKRNEELGEIDWIILQTTRRESSKAEEIEPIHSDLNCYSNSINIYVGPCGSGKSAAILRKVIKLNHH